MNIYLADEDDRIFFADTLSEIPPLTETSEFTNGVELIAALPS